MNESFAAGVETALEKTASRAANLGGAAVYQGVAGLVGHHYGGEQRRRGEKYSFGVPQAAGVIFLPGGGAYQVGRYFGHKPEVLKRAKKGK